MLSYTTSSPSSTATFISSIHNSGKVIGPVDMLPLTYSSSSSTVDGTTSSSPSSEKTRRSKSRFSSKPSWLLLSISDMEDKVQSINGEYKPDTFGERADFYYRKRPELLALLQDLYNRYLYLADRYTRALSKQQHQRHVHEHEQICHISSSHHGESESTVSCQSPHHPQEGDTAVFVISELVMKFVDYHIVVDELQNLNMIQEESKKMIEIQKSLLEVLESERVVLSNENSRLASESLFMKRKAGELARCVLHEQTDDEHVLNLSRKINELQGQICELKKKNKEYYDKLMKQQMQVNKNERKKNNGVSDESSGSNISWSGEDETVSSTSNSNSNSSTCASLASVMKGGKTNKLCTRGSDGEKRYGLWDRVKKFDLFICGHHLDATC